MAREVLEIATQGGHSIREAREPGITADLADGAQDGDSAQLLEDVGIAEDDGFRGGWLVFGLVLANDLKDSGNFLFGEAAVSQDLRGVLAGVCDVVPAGEVAGIFRAIADEYAEIVEPGSGEDDVVVIVESGADGFNQSVEARLVSKFVDGPSLIPDEVAKPVKGSGLHVTFVPQNRSYPPQVCRSGTR